MVDRDISFPLGDLELGRHFVHKGTQASQAGFAELCSTRAEPLRVPVKVSRVLFHPWQQTVHVSAQTLLLLPLLLFACFLLWLHPCKLPVQGLVQELWNELPPK